ncbi:hypothetical protein D910_10137 [Dendroctonus ponderosae]|uniref:Uncharacterized protein n=1 Tax=Dendroctonus ponderosae TaxID=77166 RepID=U4UFU3_DENPD|nr:hypothetical protein D910_10137 [Dendroctonus ponderosae]
MVTVLETPIQQKDTPERSSTAEEGRKSPTRPDVEEKPKIRLRLGLATDPAHNLLGPIKSELDAASQPTAEYLATLPPAIQSALASRGLLFPAGLNLNEAVVAMAAAQRAAASTEAVRAASVESVSASETSRTSVPIYQCVPCGIRFSSLSTLEAHQTYYCSHSQCEATPEVACPTTSPSCHIDPLYTCHILKSCTLKLVWMSETFTLTLLASTASPRVKMRKNARAFLMNPISKIR